VVVMGVVGLFFKPHKKIVTGIYFEIKKAQHLCSFICLIAKISSEEEKVNL